MAWLSSHILETSQGIPARNVEVTLIQQKADQQIVLEKALTNEDGRVSRFHEELSTGIYKLSFATSDYYKSQGLVTFFPVVEILFQVEAQEEHYHVPLLISPFQYSTYRGS